MFAREMQPTYVADGVVRMGTDLVSWYLIEDDGRVTILDTGVPSYVSQLDGGLSLLGRARADVAAIVLTHGHSDHIGFAEPLRAELGVPVYVHRGDENLTATKQSSGTKESSMLPYLRYPHAWKLLAHFASSGTPSGVRSLRTFDDGDELDVPGRPRALHTGGHTTGHTVFVLESRSVLFLGDLLCTRNPLTGGRGPQLMPRAFNLSSGTMLDSLSKLETLDVDTLLFGHGEPWTQGVAEAMRRVREVGPT
jgi:glyoxylase-like metal-dependent hydrolase (beta-lactamase superfamily II)